MDAAGLVLVAGLLVLAALLLLAELLVLAAVLGLPAVLVLAAVLALPEGLGAVGFLVAGAGVEDSPELREAPNSAAMTSPPAEAALLGLPAAFGLPAPAGSALLGLPALFGLPRASALGTFGRRVAMTLL